MRTQKKNAVQKVIDSLVPWTGQGLEQGQFKLSFGDLYLMKSLPYSGTLRENMLAEQGSHRRESCNPMGYRE